jgi:uncharacterized protein YcbX
VPRERIQQALDPKTFDVVVAWSKELNDYVEVATTAADASDRLQAWTELIHDEAGVVEPFESRPGTSFKFFDGWHVFLNRNQVNDLIRVLRRARNSAFGVDE